MAITLPADITAAREASTAATNTSNAYAGYEPTVSDVLKQKALEAYNNNQDVVKPLDVATQNYLEAPQVGREQYQDIFNPFTREKLVSQYIGTQSLPMLSLSSIMGNRMGRIEDTIGAGTRAFQAQSAAQLAKATGARQTYTDLLNEYLQTEQLRQEDYKMTHSSGGGTTINLSGLNLPGYDNGNVSNGPTLTDPSTGTTYQYDGVDDPDYINDYNLGWRPPGTPNLTPTPTITPTPSGGMKGIGAFSSNMG